MTYIELINNFWNVRRTRPMTSYEADFYFYLLKECNSRNWTSPFELPTRNIEFELGLSRKTICDLRNKLQQKGLISFKEGNKRGNGASYSISYVSTGNISGNIKGNISGNIKGNISGNTNIKNKNKDNKTINNSNELFPPEEEETKKGSRKKTEFIPPTLEEVKTYFENKLPDWEQQAEIFYDHFTSLGWRTASGVKVERWDSRANLWITDKKLQLNGENTSTGNGGCIITVPANQAGRDRDKDADTGTSQLTEWIDSIPIGK